jgi:Protein of unknown function (DUF1353)
MQKLLEPILKPIEGDLWELVEDYKIDLSISSLLSKKITVVIPRGFITDLDSVPRVPVLYEIYKGRTRIAALIHDFLYRMGCEKSASDVTFLYCMGLEGVANHYRYPIYWAVKYFGFWRYRRAVKRG